MSRKTIITLGDLNADLLIHEYTDREDNTANQAPELYGGGTMGNTAVGLARLGQRVSFWGKVGADIYGRRLTEELKKEGIEIDQVLIDEENPTILIIAHISQSGERSIYVWPQNGSAHTQFRPDELDLDKLKNAAWLHTSGLLLNEKPLSETIIKALRSANEHNIPCSIDLNIRPESFGWGGEFIDMLRKALNLCDYVFGSLPEEILPLAGCDGREEALRKLSEKKRVVIARDGRKGVWIQNPDDTQFHVPAFEVPVVDTVGAGDAFNSGFIAARVEGHSLREAVQWGHAAAGIAIGREGARQCPDRNELLGFLGKTNAALQNK